MATHLNHGDTGHQWYDCRPCRVSCRKSLLLRTQRTAATNKKWYLSSIHCIHILLVVCYVRVRMREHIDDDNGWWCAIQNHIFVYGQDHAYKRSVIHKMLWTAADVENHCVRCARIIIVIQNWAHRLIQHMLFLASDRRMSTNLYQQIYVKWANRIDVVNHWRIWIPLIAIALCPFFAYFYFRDTAYTHHTYLVLRPEAYSSFVLVLRTYRMILCITNGGKGPISIPNHSRCCWVY